MCVNLKKYHNCRGQTLTEYSILLLFVSILGISSLKFLGATVSANFDSASQELIQEEEAPSEQMRGPEDDIGCRMSNCPTRGQESVGGGTEEGAVDSTNPTLNNGGGTDEG